MTAAEILATLARSGRPQIAAIYKRHGAGDNVFGVLTSDIAKLGKKIKVDHTLAMELWKTGNAEARILALQVWDPQRLTRADANRLLRNGQSHFLGCYLAGLLGRSPMAGKIMRSWMASSDESKREIGYGMLSAILKVEPDFLSDADARKIVETIENEIRAAPNWARYTMNGALISIGVSKPSCRDAAFDAAKRIGKVHVDHGETCCETPDAAPYIEKAFRRKHGL